MNISPSRREVFICGKPFVEDRPHNLRYTRLNGDAQVRFRRRGLVDTLRVFNRVGLKEEVDNGEMCILEGNVKRRETIGITLLGIGT